MRIQSAILNEVGLPSPYAESKPLAIEEVELEGPGPGEVLVRVAFAGLCHSDLSVANGSRPRPVPMALGHEASGIVAEVGVGVDSFAPGDHVVFSYVPMCGGCVFCLSGRGALCIRGAAANTAGTLLSGARRLRRLDGTPINHHLGVSAFSEFTVVAEQSLVTVDPALPLDVAALFGCAVLTGVGSIVNTAGVVPGAGVAIFGLGGVGLSAVLGAAATGAHPLIAIDVVADKLELARGIGASHTIDASNVDPVEAIRNLTDGGAAFVFESVGNDQVLAQAYAATGRGGTTVAIGLPAPDRSFSVPAVTLVADERVVKGSYMGSAVPRRDVPSYVGLYQAGKLPVDRLLSARVGLDELNVALDKLAAGSVVRQLVEMRHDLKAL